MSRIETIAEGVTLHLGDCREMLPELSHFDAVVTDPPYGIGINKSNRLSVSRGHGGETWDDEPADIAWLLRLGVPSIVWGGNYFPLPPTRAPLVWDKNNAGRDFADFELAWTNLDMVARRIVFRPMNMDGGKVHPTQKPIEVMRWCVSYLPQSARTILDPYMGSGSTGVAAAMLGRKFIGIEINPKYFDLACSRIAEALKQPDMLVHVEQRAVEIQQDMLVALEAPDDYQPRDDFNKSINACYETVRERVAAGGPGWPDPSLPQDDAT